MNVSEYEHQHANCEGMCDIDETRIVNETEMPCVTCPFCKEIVTAKLTPTTISCPNCKVTVNRN